MNLNAIEVERLSKIYRLGVIGSATLREDLSRWWALKRGLPDPRLKVGAKEKRTEDGVLWALRDVDLRVKEGEILGIIGRNGAGKSTLLKVLSKITAPSKGRVTLRGRVASLLEVGTGFHPELTGRENVFLNGAILGMKKREIRAKLDEIVAFSEIEEFIDTPVKRYSSGMTVRLAFAVAAHLEPEILIVDEVLAVGDAAFQRKCIGKMESVHETGRTILFVSHNMVSVRNLCSRVVRFEDGKLTDDGLPHEVISKYLSVLEGNVTHQSWSGVDRPSNGVVEINCVKALKEDGEPLSEVYCADTFGVGIDFTVLRKNSTVIFVVTVNSESGECVFSSINNTDHEYFGKPMAAGPYHSSCMIPGNLLNNGVFHFDVLLYGAGFTDGRVIKDALILNIGDSPDLRAGYCGEYCGAIRPKLPWMTREILI